MNGEFLNTREAAQILDLAQETICRLIAKGKLDGQKLGSFYIVTRASVKAYAEAVDGKAKNDPTRKMQPE